MCKIIVSKQVPKCRIYLRQCAKLLSVNKYLNAEYIYDNVQNTLLFIAVRAIDTTIGKGDCSCIINFFIKRSVSVTKFQWSSIFENIMYENHFYFKISYV